MDGVKIYQISRGYEIWVWLCKDCLEKAEATGWTKKQEKQPPHPLRCDACHPSKEPQ